MTPEQRAAAERLRRYQRGDNRPYESKFEPHETDLDRVYRDRHTLADAFLAQNQAADDDEPIDAEFLREATTLPVCKNVGSGYSDNEVTLFLDDWESRQQRERFWVLTFRDDKNGWKASVSVQENHRHGGTLYMETITTRGQFRRLMSALGVELKEAHP